MTTIYQVRVSVASFLGDSLGIVVLAVGDDQICNARDICISSARSIATSVEYSTLVTVVSFTIENGRSSDDTIILSTCGAVSFGADYGERTSR